MKKILHYIQPFAIFLLLIINAIDTEAQKKAARHNDITVTRANNISIIKKWEMPHVLREVSGIEWLGNNRIACIQDEKGTIYIYNTVGDSIEKEIPFQGDFDFEGIALAGKTIYAIRSNGILYSINDYNSSKPLVKEYVTGLTTKQNTEGLCYDAKHNRLLISIKGKEPNTKEYKGIYAFDIATKKFDPVPVLKIQLNDPVFSNEGKQAMRPSDLAIHPATGDLYILDGEEPKLLIMGADGKHKKLLHMNKSDFHLAEGISFTPSGDMYISNEGPILGKGNILKVEVTE